MPFDTISDPGVRLGILRKKLGPLEDHLHTRFGLSLDLDQTVLRWLVRQSRATHGGRGLLNAVERHLMNGLARFLFEERRRVEAARRVSVELGAPDLIFELHP